MIAGAVYPVPRLRRNMNGPAERKGSGMGRIWIATLAGLAGFCLYVVAAVTLADRVHGLHWAVSALYFLLAGVLWVLPARWLMYWAAGKR